MSEIRVDNITDEAGTGRPDFSNGIKTSNINGGPIGCRNAIINGNFGVNQRGVSGTVSLSAGEYGHDRWKAGASGATYTFSTSGGVTTLDISAGSLIQVVEDVNVVTDTYVLSWEGTAQGKIGGGSFGDSGVTESVTGGSNLNIEFGTGTVSKVQLEVGDTATEFEHRPYGEELALCQRYYTEYNSSGSLDNYHSYFIPLTIFSGNKCRGTIQLPVEMRVAPTVEVEGSLRVVGKDIFSGGGNDASTVNLSSNTRSINVGGSLPDSYNNSFMYLYIADDIVKADAEL